MPGPEHDLAEIARLQRQIAGAIDPGRMFNPRMEDMTREIGGDIAHAPAKLFDPMQAFRAWQEIGAAWLRLWQPMLGAAARGAPAQDPHPIDFFISHSKRDEAAVAGFRARLDAIGSVESFVDWIDEPERDRARATRETAEWLRARMRQSKALLLLLSARSAESFWVQWELGFFDALRGEVFLVPLDQQAKAAVARQEYFQLYPTLDTPDAAIEILRSIRSGEAARPGLPLPASTAQTAAAASTRR